MPINKFLSKQRMTHIKSALCLKRWYKKLSMKIINKTARYDRESRVHANFLRNKQARNRKANLVGGKKSH